MTFEHDFPPFLFTSKKDGRRKGDWISNNRDQMSFLSARSLFWLKNNTVNKSSISNQNSFSIWAKDYWYFLLIFFFYLIRNLFSPSHLMEFMEQIVLLNKYTMIMDLIWWRWALYRLKFYYIYNLSKYPAIYLWKK